MSSGEKRELNFKVELPSGFLVERWNYMENFPAFYPLLKAFLGEVYGSPEKGLTVYQSKYRALDYYRNYRSRPNSYLLILRAPDSSLAGFLYARKKKGGTYIYDIFVKPEYRGMGLGRALLTALSRLSPLPFTADVCHKSLPAFKRWGFSETAPAYAEDGVVWHPVKLTTL